jgi:hypothetical protein
MLWKWHTVQDVIFFLVPFFLGPIGEAIAIYNGAWKYTKPVALIPMWLPLAWGCAALYMKKTADALVERHANRQADRFTRLTSKRLLVQNGDEKLSSL